MQLKHAKYAGLSFWVVLKFLTCSAHADFVLYSEDFNTPNSATSLENFGWTAFRGGSPSSPALSGSGTTTGGVFGAQRAAFINLDTSNSTTSWFGGMFYDYNNALPTMNLSDISLTANVYGGGTVGNRGNAILRIESSAGNWLGFLKNTSVNNGGLTGGFLSNANASSGTFDPTASSFRVTLAFADTISTWGNDGSNILGIDNVTLSAVAVPEPSSLALVGMTGLVAGSARLRCRRKRELAAASESLAES